jgi:hypothetical protein
MEREPLRRFDEFGYQQALAAPKSADRLTLSWRVGVYWMSALELAQLLTSRKSWEIIEVQESERECRNQDVINGTHESRMRMLDESYQA